jgi:hypothetical protein
MGASPGIGGGMSRMGGAAAGGGGPGVNPAKDDPEWLTSLLRKYQLISTHGILD